MKSRLIFSILISMLTLISHAKKNNLSTSNKDSVVAKFVVNNSIDSRTNGSYRYILEIYEVVNGSTHILIEHIEQHTHSFDVYLKPGANYSCLFWVDQGIAEDNSSGVFDATSLKSVKVNRNMNIDEAFFCKDDFIMPDDPIARDITLKRAVAKVELIEIGLVNIDINIDITFMGYQEFDVSSECPIGALNISKTVSTIATTGLIGTFVTFAPTSNETSAGMVVDLTAVYNNSATNNIPNVRLSNNYITKINGNFAIPN